MALDLINSGDSRATTKAKLDAAFAEVGLPASGDTTEATDTFNELVADYLVDPLPGLTDGMAGSTARSRINAAITALNEGGRAWPPENALFAIETIPDGRRYRCGAPVNVNATGGHALDLSGAYVLFGANAPRMTDLGLLVEEATTRLSRYPATPQANWGLAGASKVAVSGTFLGLFANASRATSGGQNWHRIDTAMDTLVSGQPYGVTVLYAAGSSGRCRVVMRNNTGATETILTGLVGALAAGGALAGTVSNIEQDVMSDGVYRVRFSFTPNANTSSYMLGIGADTTSTGNDVICVGGWLESSTPSSPIIANPITTVARAADTLTIPGISAGTYDLHLRYTSGADRVVAGWAYNDPLPFDSRQIVMAWGEAA